MLLTFFDTLRRHKIPVSTRELLDCLGLLKAGLGRFSWDEFYQLSRISLVKDEKFYDRFDQAFAEFFSGINQLESLVEADVFERSLLEVLDTKELPISELVEARRNELQTSVEQSDIDQETGQDGLSDNSDGEPGQGESGEDGEGEEGEQGEEGEEGEEGKKGEKGERGEEGEGDDGIEGRGESEDGEQGSKETFEKASQKASQLWALRRFEALDEEVELGTRNLKIALRRIRKLARTGAQPELDLDTTIRRTARNGGLLDIVEVPERRNSVKVLLFLDIGGSMDEHVLLSEQLFAAAKYEFKYLEAFYFHNFLYEKIWTDVERRDQDKFLTNDLFRKFSSDYKVIFVGDANMGGYEITETGGSVEHFNARSGEDWFADLKRHFRRVVWLNPVTENRWLNSNTTGHIQRLLENEMYPLSVAGIDQAARSLVR